MRINESESFDPCAEELRESNRKTPKWYRKAGTLIVAPNVEQISEAKAFKVLQLQFCSIVQ